MTKQNKPAGNKPKGKSKGKAKRNAPRRRRAAKRNPPRRAATPKRRRRRARKNPPSILTGAFARQALGVVAGGIAAVALTAATQRVVDDPEADTTVGVVVPFVASIAAMQVGGDLGRNMALGALGVTGAAIGGVVASAINDAQSPSLAALPKPNPAGIHRLNPPGYRRLNPPPAGGYPQPFGAHPRAAFR